MRNVIDVQYLDQSVRYPTGCESVSAVMVQSAYELSCGCPFHHIFLCGIRGGPGQTPHRMA